MDINSLIDTFFGFIIFCIISGCVYILNDITDVEKDRQHPEKKNRPIAAGKIEIRSAIAGGIILYLIAIVSAFILNKQFGILVLLYFIINVVYTYRLKHVVIIDVMIIAAGFVIRAVAGAVLIHVIFTSWFLLCTMQLALFLALAKRRHELLLLADEKGSYRKVLDEYSPELLDQLITIVTASTIMTYSLYTFTAPKGNLMMLTIPLVLYGIFRYLYLVHKHKGGGKPEDILLDDPHVLVTVGLYAISILSITMI